MKKALYLAGAIVFALPLGLTTTATAEVIKLQAELRGSNEVPPNASAGSGKAEAAFDTATKVLTYTVTYSGLSGPALGAHFHVRSTALLGWGRALGEARCVNG